MEGKHEQQALTPKNPDDDDIIEVKEEDKDDDDAMSKEEYFLKHGVVKPPAPPPGHGSHAPSVIAGGSQGAVATLVNRLKKPAEKKILTVETHPFKAVVALVTQMTFGNADKAELLVSELLVLICHVHVHVKVHVMSCHVMACEVIYMGISKHM